VETASGARAFKVDVCDDDCGKSIVRDSAISAPKRRTRRRQIYEGSIDG